MDSHNCNILFRGYNFWNGIVLYLVDQVREYPGSIASLVSIFVISLFFFFFRKFFLPTGRDKHRKITTNFNSFIKYFNSAFGVYFDHAFAFIYTCGCLSYI